MEEGRGEGGKVALLLSLSQHSEESATLRRVKHLKELSIDNKRMYCGLHGYSLVIGEDRHPNPNPTPTSTTIPTSTTTPTPTLTLTRRGPPQLTCRRLGRGQAPRAARRPVRMVTMAASNPNPDRSPLTFHPNPNP